MSSYSSTLRRRHSPQIGSLFYWIDRASEISRERRALAEASPETLRDIGVEPGDARAEAERPFWDLPESR